MSYSCVERRGRGGGRGLCDDAAEAVASDPDQGRGAMNGENGESVVAQGMDASTSSSVNASHAIAPHPRATMRGSLLPERLARRLQQLERHSRLDPDSTTALRETVEALWKTIEWAAAESALDASQHRVRALLARRELVRCGTRILSAVIRRGVAAGVFRPACPAWAIRRLPFAIVAGACVRWVFGLSHRPSFRASTAVQATLEVLCPCPPAGGFRIALV